MSKIKKIKFALIYIVLMLIIVSAEIYIIQYFIDINNVKKESNLLNEINIERTKSMDNNTTISKSEEIYEDAIKIVKTERMLKLEKLQKQNSDIVAWLEIKNTKINFPVLQGSDNKFYMTHNYKKEYSKNGSIFLDKNFSFEPLNTNFLIYGHNMRNGTMFEDLLKYKDIKFYKEHPTIRFTTNQEDSTYEILAVFKSKVYYKSEKNVFRYYYFLNASNENEFNEYINNSKSVSLYDTGISANYGDQLLTLSTCSYHVKDGRFVVVAKKRES